jgi:hypothetical protein
MWDRDFWKTLPLLPNRKEQDIFMGEVVTLVYDDGNSIWNERTLRRKGIPLQIHPGSLWAELGQPPPNIYLKTLKEVSSYYDIPYGTLKLDRKEGRLFEPQRIGNTHFWAVNSCDACRWIQYRSKKNCDKK